jgi:hypothetical protein
MCTEPNNQHIDNTYTKNERNPGHVNLSDLAQSQDSLIQTVPLQSADPYNHQTESFKHTVARNLTFQPQEMNSVHQQDSIVGLEGTNQIKAQQIINKEMEVSLEKENIPDSTSRIPGPECQSFKQKRKHPYSSTRPGRAKNSSLLSVLRN